METKINDITDGIKKLADISMGTFKTTIESASRNLSDMSKVMSGLGLGTFTLPSLKKDDHECCPPKHECPPHCILQITRTASAGERIIVPFMVKNNCNTQKKYRVGVRDLKHIDGSMAPAQPVLNKNEVTLEPGQSELVLMSLDLLQFSNGNTYNAEIVVREKDINQNICFTLKVDGNNAVPVATPLDEKKYLLRWQSWRSHFYCEPKKENRVNG